MPATQQTEAEAKKLSEKIYDMFMQRIEPDLMLATIDTLDAKYAGETAKEKAARMKRYEKAYATFDQEFAEFMGTVHGQMTASRRKALTQKEQAARTQESTALDSLEAAFG